MSAQALRALPVTADSLLSDSTFELYRHLGDQAPSVWRISLTWHARPRTLDTITYRTDVQACGATGSQQEERDQRSKHYRWEHTTNGAITAQ